MKRAFSPAGFQNFCSNWLPVTAYCLLIYWQSSHVTLKAVSDAYHIDKGIHLVAYAVLGILFYRALACGRKDRPGACMLLSILLASLYGVSDEIHQYFVPFRHADLLDLLADGVGSGLGVIVYGRLRNDRRPRTLLGISGLTKAEALHTPDPVRRPVG
ncbi:MAG: VanZ family protein [Desulfobacterales bacterium]|nr:VanZ family protein [Desulfobacterales bacterium]